MIKAGKDLAHRTLPFLRSLTNIGDMRFVRMVPSRTIASNSPIGPRSERVEVLSGGVPGWSPREIDAVLPTLERTLHQLHCGQRTSSDRGWEGARRPQRPSYADLHSLFLNVESDGRRSPRYLPSSARWAGCFDTVQMNQNEFELFVRGAPDPWSVAEEAMADRLKAIVVTLGAGGAEIMTRGQGGAPPIRESVPVVGGPVAGDPTGCGDVWGATFFSQPLSTEHRHWTPPRRANAMASRKLGFSGAEAFRNALS